MPIGLCRLCKNERQLLDSHLLPKAYYKLLRIPTDENPNPIVATGQRAYKTSGQVKDYLLCGACEDRFNKGGEAWVKANTWHGPEKFPILSALNREQPDHADQEAGFLVYDCAASVVDIEKIAYFGASVFWRAGVHRWRAAGLKTALKLELGPYEEQLRLFLMGEAPFPEDAALHVNVNSDSSIVRNEYMLFPFVKPSPPGNSEYRFVIPGLGFSLVTGKGLPDPFRMMCAARNKKLFISVRHEEQTLRGAQELFDPRRLG